MNRLVWRWALACTLFAVLFSCGTIAASESLGDGSLRKGRQIFQKYCAGCHGPKGQGNGYRLLGPTPADLSSLLTQQKADEDLLKVLHTGKPNMPAWNIELTAMDRQNVLAYIRSLGE